MELKEVRQDLSQDFGFCPDVENQLPTCSYLDASLMPLPKLGELHEELSSRKSSWSPPEAFGLVTCQRVEVYSIGPPACLPGLDMAHLLDPVAVHQRLTEIAAGVRSQLLGERFVLEQVEQAMLALPPKHPLVDLVAEAIEVARRVRQIHRFVAEADYPELACRRLSSGCGTTVVVGGGMLASAVVNRALDLGTKVIQVTRSPQKLRRRLGATHHRLRIASYRNLYEEINGRPYNTILATSQVTAALQSLLANLVSASQCDGVIDLCSVPVCSAMPPKAPYITMYSPEFLIMVNEANEKLRARADEVRRTIAAHYRRDDQ